MTDTNEDIARTKHLPFRRLKTYELNKAYHRRFTQGKKKKKKKKRQVNQEKSQHEKKGRMEEGPASADYKNETVIVLLPLPRVALLGTQTIFFCKWRVSSRPSMAPSRATWVRAYTKRFVIPGKFRGRRRGGASRDSAEAKNIVTREAADSTCQAQGSCLYQHIPKPSLLSVLCVTLVVRVLFYRHFYFPDQLAGAYTLDDIVLSFT